MRRFYVVNTILLVVVVGLSMTSCSKGVFEIEPLIEPSSLELKSVSFYSDLAQRWAPVHYQDVDVTGALGFDHALNGKSDYITNVDFDGNWNATDNWDHTASYDLNAHCYYSVVETETHYFLLYSFFHPRDWTDNGLWILFGGLDEHENDMEGALMVVKKDGTTYGDLQGMVTTFHTSYLSYVPSGSPLTGNQQSIAGTLSFQTHPGDNLEHPKTAQECRGHGLKAHPYCNIVGDGIIYFPEAVAEVPANNYDTHCGYQLVDIFTPGGLWDQRNNSDLFYSYGNFDGGSHGRGANAPWAWNGGTWATNPVAAANYYFSNLGVCSTTYIFNPYTGVGN
jgi:hypothetical protein